MHICARTICKHARARFILIMFAHLFMDLRTVIDAGWTEALDRNPKIQELTYEDIVDLRSIPESQGHEDNQEQGGVDI